MIDLPAGFAARLAAEATTLAFCWRVVRADGVALGFTSHDRDLDVDGFTYRATPGIAPSAVQLSGGLDIDSMDIAGALSADAITEADLSAGRYDGAWVSLFLVDWEAADAGRIPLMRGTLGAITHGETSFSAELKGPTQSLEQPALELLSPECRAQLGDRRCRVDIASHTRLARLDEVVSDQTLRIDGAEPVANAYGYGRLRFLSGANSGLGVDVVSSAGTLVHLAEAPAFICASGDRVELRQGCDKRFVTCGTRFANAANFQGEPHVPGNDLLTRYPGL